jgi:hypothetical protein
MLVEICRRLVSVKKSHARRINTVHLTMVAVLRGCNSKCRIEKFTMSPSANFCLAQSLDCQCIAVRLKVEFEICR